jgi:hypothetical protein
MPETDFSRLDHRVPIARAEVNVRPLDPGMAQRVIRDDAHAYGPLSDPAGTAHGWSPPSPPPKTEEQLRQQLTAALEAEHQAEDRLALSQSAHARAIASPPM